MLFLTRSVQPLVSPSLGLRMCFHLLSAVCTSRQGRLLVFASVIFWEASSLRAGCRKHLGPHLSAGWTGGLFFSMNHIVTNFSPSVLCKLLPVETPIALLSPLDPYYPFLCCSSHLGLHRPDPHPWFLPLLPRLPLSPWPLDALAKGVTWSSHLTLAQLPRQVGLTRYDSLISQHQESSLAVPWITKRESEPCNVAVISVQRGKRKMYSCISTYLPQLHAEGLGDVLDSGTPLLLGCVIPRSTLRCRQRKESGSNDDLLPVTLLTAQFDYRDISRRGCREEPRLPLVGRKLCSCLSLPWAAHGPCSELQESWARSCSPGASPSFTYPETQNPNLLVVHSVEGKYQPQLTCSQWRHESWRHFVMATTLASWEDIEGAAFCSITTVPSLPLSLRKNAILEVLGKGELPGANPQVSAVLGPPLPSEAGKRNKIWEADEGGPAGDFLILDSWKMKVEIEGVCLKKQLHELPFIFFPCHPPGFSIPSHTPNPTAILSALQQLQMDGSAMCCRVSRAKAVNKVFWRNTTLPCLFNFAFPRYTHRHCKLSIRSRTTISLFTIRRVSCSQSSPTCKFFTIPFI